MIEAQKRISVNVDIAQGVTPYEYNQSISIGKIVPAPPSGMESMYETEYQIRERVRLLTRFDCSYKQ